MTKSHTLTRLCAPALALGLALPLASAPALAGSQQPIEVTSTSAMKEWKSDVSRQLHRALQQAPERRSAVPGSGIVQVTFEVDEQGRPTNLEIRQNSANWASGRMARYAVKRIATMNDAPLKDVGEARFLANIVFANSVMERDVLLRELQQSERTRLASGADEGDIIVLWG